MPVLATLLTLMFIGVGGKRPSVDCKDASTSAEPATSDKTSEETGRSCRPPAKRQAGRGEGAPPELPLELWRVVWSKLSPTELLRAAGVSRQWRRECTGDRRDEAIALVTAPETLPDSDLSRPQQALRGIQRILRRQNPFSAKPLPRNQNVVPDSQDIKEKRGSDSFLFTLGYVTPGGGASESSYFQYEFLEERGPDGRGASRLVFVMEWHPWRVGPDSVDISLGPRSPEACTWMQGLLLVLTGGFRGLLQYEIRSDMPGSLAECDELRVAWNGRCPRSKMLWPLRKAHIDPELDSVETYIRGPNTWLQIFRF